MTLRFIPPNKVLSFFYIGPYCLMVVQNGVGRIEVMHLSEIMETNILEE